MKLQILFNPGCRPDEYRMHGKSLDFPDMVSKLCPQCKGGYLKKHGFYERYLIEPGFEGAISIRRYYCRYCRKTVSLLPSFCHPKRTYGINAIVGVLSKFYTKTLTVCLAVKDFFSESGVDFSRQQLLHYRRRIEKNLNSLAMAITEIYALRAPPITESVNTGEKVRQLLPSIHAPMDISLKIFEQTGRTYLTD